MQPGNLLRARVAQTEPLRLEAGDTLRIVKSSWCPIAQYTPYSAEVRIDCLSSGVKSGLGCSDGPELCGFRAGSSTTNQT